MATPNRAQSGPNKPQEIYQTANFDPRGAFIFATAVIVLGLSYSACNYFRQKPGSFSQLTLKIKARIKCGFKCPPGKSPPAQEERAVKAVVSDPIPSSKFLTLYKQRSQRKQQAVEFKALARNQEEHSAHTALKNVFLNFKQDVVTYDHSRVIVWDLPDSVTSDYYNASYIDGYHGPKEYIASQGPTSKCPATFWHMVWQEGVTCIVMATGLFENAVPQCEKYWPDYPSNYVQHGNIHIWLQKSVQLAQLDIRFLRLQKQGCSECREVVQYEMSGFHEENPDPGLLLDVRRRVQVWTSTHSGPILVHCRCGGGRTAVYIAVDYCLHQLQAEDRVDVYAAVLHLRRFRKNMVRTLAQYNQIYNTIAIYMQCGPTVFPADSLVETVLLHYEGSGDSKSSKLEKEFQTLQSIVPHLSIGDCASGHRVENRSKSRDIMMLPPECARPYLTTADCGESGTDFINAVYVDGYHHQHAYLVTQWPMKKTICDLWRMLFDYKIKTLVVMNDSPQSTRNYPRFWPQEVNDILSYGPVSVKYCGLEKHKNMVIRTLAIRKSLVSLMSYNLRPDETLVKMFQLTGAAKYQNNSQRLSHRQPPHPNFLCRLKDDACMDKGLGLHSDSLLEMMELINDWEMCSNNRKPICVVSKDGSSRAGLYCAISVCCDQIRQEHEVDVFNAVRLVRRYRPQLVPTLEEYKYIYKFMAEFVTFLKTKPNIIVSGVLPSPPPHLNSLPYVQPVSFPASCIHGGVYIVPGQQEQAVQAAHANSSRLNHANMNNVIRQKPHHDFLWGYRNGAYEQNIYTTLPKTPVPCSLGKHLINPTLSNSLIKTNKIYGTPNRNACTGLSESDSVNSSFIPLEQLAEVKNLLNQSQHIAPTQPALNRNVSSCSLPVSSSPWLPPGTVTSTPFLTPQKYQQGLEVHLTSSNHSHSSFHKSASFFTCSSNLSVNSGQPGEFVSSATESNGIPSRDLTKEIVIQPKLLKWDICDSKKPDGVSPLSQNMSVLSSSLEGSKHTKAGQDSATCDSGYLTLVCNVTKAGSSSDFLLSTSKAKVKNYGEVSKHQQNLPAGNCATVSQSQVCYGQTSGDSTTLSPAAQHVSSSSYQTRPSRFSFKQTLKAFRIKNMF